MTRRRLGVVLGALLAVLLLVVLVVRLALPPGRAPALILDQLGDMFDLKITATGRAELQLRGTPTLVLRDVVAKQADATTPLLRAERILLALPWSTLRSRGEPLDLIRIELDAPTLDLPALRRWQATRPPAVTRIPSLRDGLRIENGRVDDIGWRIEALDARLPELHPDKPVNAALRGRFADASTALPFDLALALTAPAGNAGVAVVGELTLERADWQLPARIKLSGPLRAVDGGLRVTPARLAMSGAYVADDARLPFALGMQGPLRYQNRTWTLAPAGIALRGQAPLPEFDARGALALGRRLVLRLAGTLPHWPQAWPTLPPPLEASSSPLPFVLDYVGTANLAQVTRLQLQRDEARFDARFRLPAVLAWIDDGGDGTPLPPLSGTASAPRLEISGAQLEGVEIAIDEPGVPAPDDAR